MWALLPLVPQIDLRRALHAAVSAQPAAVIAQLCQDRLVVLWGLLFKDDIVYAYYLRFVAYKKHIRGSWFQLKDSLYCDLFDRVIELPASRFLHHYISLSNDLDSDSLFPSLRS